MSIIDRSDLKYDYKWSSEFGKEPRTKATTKDSSKPNTFRPDEGDQVLTFLNGYAESRNISDKEDVRNLEPLLHKRLEEVDEMTREEMEEWLDNQREQ